MALAETEDDQEAEKKGPTVEEYYGPYLQLSREACLAGDPQEDDFIGFRDHFFCDVAPQDAIEKMLVDRLVACIWRLRRAGRIENELFAQLYAHSNNMSDASSEAGNDQASSGANMLLQVAAEVRPKEFSALEWLQRYESHLDRSVHSALTALNHHRYLEWQMKPRDVKPESEGEADAAAQ